MLPYPAGPVEFEATAYCEAGITKAGVPAAPGLAAADESVLPLGTLVHVEGKRHRGIYRIMDTGRLVKGRIIDIYMTDLEDALEFGRQKVRVTVLQHGRPARRGVLAD
jgi:3D (Asp-Asp-Asp) domain-containing protein